MTKNRVISIIIIVLFCTVLFSDPPNWVPITGTEYSMVVIAEISLYNLPFAGIGTNMAGAFGPGGETDCRSVGTWEEPNPPYWDGHWYFTIVGNTNGEVIGFKIYDEATDLIYDCNVTVIFEDGATIGSPTDPLNLSAMLGEITGNVSLITTIPPAGNIEQVEITAGYITVNPDANGDYLLEIAEGTYDVSASLNAYETVTLSNIEVLATQPVENLNFSLIDWIPIGGTQYSMVVMATVNIGSDLFEGVGSNQVAAFGPGGYTDCRSLGLWEEANPPYWDGYWYFTVVGSTNGETIEFQIFDEETQTIYECAQTVTFQDNNTIGSPEDPFELTIGIDQEFSLGIDWNWISFNVHPEYTEIESVFAALGNNIFQIKNQTQSSIYYDPPGTWVGDLDNISDGEAYLIKMNNAVAPFIVSGMPIEPITPIELTQDWNWIAYYPQFILPIDAALQSIIPNVYQIKNQTQSAIYYDPPGTWVGDLTQMEPNIGYKINMLNADQLVYPEPVEFIPSNNLYREDPPDWEVITGTQYNMILMAQVEFNLEPFDNTDDNMVGAFGPGGEQDCRSIGVWQPPNPPNWDGFWYFTIVGNIEGEDISFKIYDSNSETIYDCYEIIVFEDGATIGSPTDLYELTCGETASEDILPANEKIMLANYPNPFNPTTTIYFETTDLHENSRIEIYNIKGRKIKTFHVILSGVEGQSSIIWDGTDENNQPVGSGIYFYKLNLKDSPIKKMILLK
ncbi:MAG: T9SS type A sorting domain-containing protein [Armatimonadetes bacterium]|nr:T9SS type A sorting domain-containing protein [Armatimonadota bacterium]